MNKFYDLVLESIMRHVNFAGLLVAEQIYGI